MKYDEYTYINSLRQWKLEVEDVDSKRLIDIIIYYITLTHIKVMYSLEVLSILVSTYLLLEISNYLHSKISTIVDFRQRQK